MGFDPPSTFQRRQAARREKNAKRAVLVERARASEAKLRSALLAFNKPKEVDSEFAPLARACPKMAEHLGHYPVRGPGGLDDYSRGVSALLRLVPVRRLAEWKPRGKSPLALFRSLAGHLLARYPMPAFLWGAFFGDSNRRLFIPLVRHLAGGGSLPDYLEASDFPVQLTRRVCHAFLQSSAELSVVEALRVAQLRGAGADPRLDAAVLATRLGAELGPRDEEEFHQGFFGWLARQPMLDPHQVGPIIDYLGFCRGQDPAWSLKGRTAVSVIRAMEQWHHETGRAGIRGHTGAAVFKPSGFEAAEFDFSRDTTVETWRIAEVLTARDLAAEGKRQGHCVFSYHRQIEAGICSIWTLSKEDNRSREEHGGVWNMLTLEVRNDLRTVVQARGRFNRRATVHELGIIQRWLTTRPGA